MLKATLSCRYSVSFFSIIFDSLPLLFFSMIEITVFVYQMFHIMNMNFQSISCLTVGDIKLFTEL